MPIDPQAEAFLSKIQAMDGEPFELMGAESARSAVEADAALLDAPLPMKAVQDLSVPGPGGVIPVRCYHPDGEAPLPALVYFHGGGWVLGNIPTHDTICTQLAHGAQCVVVSVDYRLAPEHPFPAAAEDAHAATQWVIAHGEELGVDPRRVAVGGDSAGGNLATVACLIARDRSAALPVLQVLIYPITDCDFETPSYRENAEGYLLTRSTMQWFWKCYVQDEADMYHPYASPLQAADLSGLPPALVLTAEFDPLRDEAEAYARRLQSSNVPTTLTRYDGMIHAFIRRTDIFDQAHMAQQEVCRALRDAFHNE